MVSGGGDYNKEGSRAVRLASVLITPVLALYALLIAFGMIYSNHYIGDPVVVIGLSAFWVVLSLYYYIKPINSAKSQAFRVVLFHILAVAMFTLVMGFSQPFVALFALLFLASYIFFGRQGLAFSIATFVAAALFDIMIRYPTQPNVLYETGVSALAVLLLGFAIIGIISTQETKRKALLRSREREHLQYDRILTIMNNLTDAAFSTDTKGKILLYNAASLDLLDTNDTVRGKFIGDILNLTNGDGDKIDLFAVLKEGTKANRRDDLSHTYADGEVIRLEVTAAPIRSSYSLNKKGEELGGYIVIVRDVTKKKTLEEERDEFISVVSHELRTPITIVEGTLSNLEFMMQHPHKVDEKVLAGSMKTAHDQVLYLAKMVNDLSTLSRAERGVADAPELIDATDLLHRLHKQYSPDAEAHKLHLNLEITSKLGNVNVSRLYLEELLQNFITNAIKYTHAGSVTILASQAKGVITFSVKDTGIGMSRSDQAKVFHKFYRSEDYRIRETNGTGLGLYVSTKLAFKLNTKIELKSRLNHGSTFSFEVPAA